MLCGIQASFTEVAHMFSDDNIYDICIVGAGFSGLILAIKLKRAGLDVCLVDLNAIVGRRILSTGNGRCNFTNSHMGKDFYYSESDLGFIDGDIYKRIISFFNEIGVIEKSLDGYYYPITNQAKTIREALENETNRLSITCYLECRATDIDKSDDNKVTTNRGNISAKKVCIATGGLSAPNLGSSKFGYKMAEKFSLNVTPLSPALVGLKSKDIRLKELAGVRALGAVTYSDYKFTGEIQFNKDGLSGYPVMCLSRFVGLDEINNKVLGLGVDFVPYLNEHKLREDINRRIERNIDGNISAALLGICNEKALKQIISESKIYNDTSVKDLDEMDISNLIQSFKDFKFKITGTKGFDNAQVTAGGVDLNGIDINTFESKTAKGLYFSGEVLDVDGICGGYNLSFAFLSSEIIADAITGAR